MPLLKVSNYGSCKHFVIFKYLLLPGLETFLSARCSVNYNNAGFFFSLLMWSRVNLDILQCRHMPTSLWSFARVCIFSYDITLVISLGCKEFNWAVSNLVGRNSNVTKRWCFMQWNAVKVMGCIKHRNYLKPLDQPQNNTYVYIPVYIL